jgi:hypothetical protein
MKDEFIFHLDVSKFQRIARDIQNRFLKRAAGGATRGLVAGQ